MKFLWTDSEQPNLLVFFFFSLYSNDVSNSPITIPHTTGFPVPHYIPRVWLVTYESSKNSDPCDICNWFNWALWWRQVKRSSRQFLWGSCKSFDWNEIRNAYSWRRQYLKTNVPVNHTSQSYCMASSSSILILFLTEVRSKRARYGDHSQKNSHPCRESWQST